MVKAGMDTDAPGNVSQCVYDLTQLLITSLPSTPGTMVTPDSTSQASLNCTIVALVVYVTLFRVLRASPHDPTGGTSLQLQALPIPRVFFV